MIKLAISNNNHASPNQKLLGDCLASDRGASEKVMAEGRMQGM